MNVSHHYNPMRAVCQGRISGNRGAGYMNGVRNPRFYDDDDATLWIPAFAGMTGCESGMDGA